jgi:hypothetical protein
MARSARSRRAPGPSQSRPPAPARPGTDRAGLTIGYLVGGGIMIIGGLVELVWGINAEGKSLEDIALPLTAVGVKEAGVR